MSFYRRAACPKRTACCLPLLILAWPVAAIQKLAREFLRQYVWIAIGRVGSTVNGKANFGEQERTSASDWHELLAMCLPSGITQRLVLASEAKRHKLKLVADALQV